MTTSLTPEEFSAHEGVADWHVADGMAVARFDTGSFVKGVEFIGKISELAEAANHHPDIDLRYPSVTARLVTHDAGTSLTEADVDLARSISAAARSMGIAVAPAL